MLQLLVKYEVTILFHTHALTLVLADGTRGDPPFLGGTAGFGHC